MWCRKVLAWQLITVLSQAILAFTIQLKVGIFIQIKAFSTKFRCIFQAIQSQKAHILFQFEEMAIEMLLQSLICIINAKLLEAIFLKTKIKLSINKNHLKHCTLLKWCFELQTWNDSKPYISRMFMDLPVRLLPTSRDLLICSTSQSNNLA